MPFFYFTASRGFSGIRNLTDPTTATSMKTSLRKTPHPFKPFRDYPKSPKYLKKKGIYVGAEERGPHPSSERDGRIYRLAVPVLKNLKLWSFHVVVVQGRKRNVPKSLMHVQRCCFAN